MQSELGADYRGSFKIQLVGPWTLAATVEKPRGDKVLSDHGARRDLGQALAEGLRGHIGDVRRRLPAATRLIVQLDEPALAAVLGGRVPTASGFGRHRVVHPPEASQLLSEVVAAVVASGAEPWVHSCAPDTPLALLRGAGARGLAVDLGVLSAADHDELGSALEAGETVCLGVVAPVDPMRRPSQSHVTESVVRWLDMLGLDPLDVSDQLVLSPGCGLAGASRSWAAEALSLVQFAASRLTVSG
jgi:methionine synthase II (cobalamin-independent)